MNRRPSDEPGSKSSRFAGLAFLVVIVATIFKSLVWRLRGASPQRESEKFWDMMARDFDRNAQNEKVAKNHVEIVKIIRAYLDGRDAVLDCGCGTGTASIEIADVVKHVHGIDISGKMIEAARTKASARKIENVKFTQSTVFDASLHEESFDAILALNVLHLLSDAPAAVSRINELLKPGGLFISVTECMGEKRSSLNALISLLSAIGVLPRFTFFKVSELEVTVAGGSFQMVQAESFYDFGSQPSRFIAARKASRRRSI